VRSRLEIVVTAVAVVYLLFMLALVRRRQLREKYAFLWLAVGVAVVLLAVARSVADRVAAFLGFAYGPSAVFLFSTIFLMGVAAHLSWEVSRLEDRTRRLAQEVALLKPQLPAGADINLTDERSAPPPPDGGSGAGADSRREVP
jgi:hypothetical protein